MHNERLELFEFRAAYLATGPNAADAIKECFAPLPVDTDSIRTAGDNVEALAEANINFVILPYDLGFPPEESGPQREYFRKFSIKASSFGIETLSLVTTSSFYPHGSFKKAPWTALLPNGKPVQYSFNSKRIIACWNSPEWIGRLEVIACESIEAGASGVMLDPIFFGAAPVLIDGGFEGPAGCFCPRCRDRFRAEHGSKGKNFQKIPVRADPDNEVFRVYADWRSSIVTESLERIRASIKNVDSSALFGIIAPNLTYYPTRIMYGLDPEWTLAVPDVCCIEHHRQASISKTGLTYQSPSIKVMRAASRGPLIASISFPYGPAHDTVPSPDAFSSSMAESFSCGAAPVIRAGEYRGTKDKIGDFVTSSDYYIQRNSISSAYNWIEKNPELFEDATPVSATGVLFSMKRLQRKPYPFVSLFYKIVHTLTETQVPVELLVEETIDEKVVADLRVIVIPEAADIEPEDAECLSSLFEGKRIIFTGAEAEWLKNAERINPGFAIDSAIRKKSFRSGSLVGRALIRRLYSGGAGLFGGFPISRRSGINPVILGKVESMRYLYAPPENWKTLRDIVVEAHKNFPENMILEAPPYIHVNEWKNGVNSVFHVVNILPGFPGPAQAALRFPAPMNARVIDAFNNKITYIKNENSIVVKPQPYTIVEVKDRYRRIE